MSRHTIMIALILGLLFVGMVVGPAVAELQTVTLTIDGMT